MDVNKFLVRQGNLSAKKVEDELILLGEDETKIYTLNETGRRIWELADGQRQIKEIAQILASEFNITPEKAKTDILNFLAKANNQTKIFDLRDFPS